MLRSNIVNFRKNWVCQTSKWNYFWKNLALDMIDINNEMSSYLNYPHTTFCDKIDDILENINGDNRAQYPKL